MFINRKLDHPGQRIVDHLCHVACSHAGVSVTAVPARHIGLACGYVIEAEGRTVYFAGDTQLGPHLRAIGERFHLDLALLPLRPLRLVPVMRPKDIVPAVRALGSPAVALIHLCQVGNWLRFLALPDPVPEVAELLAREAPEVQLKSWKAGVPLFL